jgi:DNA-binding response OmpR family regulator
MDSKPRLLIVDDIADNRAVLARRLGRQGFLIVEAESGERALDLIGGSHFDLILLDVMMPGLDGVEVLKRIREQHAPMQLPVIMVTAKADGSDVAESLEAGANDYITKPVDFIAALARIKTQLERKKAKDELEQANNALHALNGSLEQRIAERMAELVETNEALKREIA